MSDLNKYSYSRSVSPTDPYQTPESASRRSSAHYIKQEPRNYTPSGHRRSFDDDIILPLTPVSNKFDSPTMAAIDPRDRALDRMPNLQISDRDQKPRSRFDDYEDIPYSSMSAAERRLLQTVPVQHPRPIAAYPVSYNWPVEGMNTDSAEVKRDGAIAMDPALSSVRSSAEAVAAVAAAAAAAGEAAAAVHAVGAVGAPELRLPETLGSAAASPAIDASGEASASQLKDDDGLAPPDKKETPFSRSPELRVSHKLAERKRRKEMRDLFDELREALPADRGMKASKWEILSKAVDYIAHLKSQMNEASRTIEMMHRDLAAARGDNPSTTWPTSYPHFTGIPQYVPPHNASAAAAVAAAAVATAAAPAPAAPVAAQAPAPAVVPAAAQPTAAQPAAVPAAPKSS